MNAYDLPNVRFRPIEQWPGRLLSTWERKRAQFRAPWPKTLKLLQRELDHLDAGDVLVQADFTERDIRLDGYPRSGARAGHPGIIIAFTSIYGPLQYATDAFDDWRDNLRAIALALESLRAVDRYGVTKRGEQYRGWKALTSPATGPMTVEQAARFLAEQADTKAAWRTVIESREQREAAYRLAARKLHPDAGGEHDTFVRLQDAKQLLDKQAG